MLGRWRSCLGRGRSFLGRRRLFWVDGDLFQEEPDLSSEGGDYVGSMAVLCRKGASLARKASCDNVTSMRAAVGNIVSHAANLKNV